MIAKFDCHFHMDMPVCLSFIKHTPHVWKHWASHHMALWQPNPFATDTNKLLFAHSDEGKRNATLPHTPLTLTFTSALVSVTTTSTNKLHNTLHSRTYTRMNE